jgi:hypothetical protein
MVARLADLAAGRAPGVGGARVTAASAFRSGVRRVNRAPAVVLGVWIATLLVAVPLGLSVREALERQLGSSLEAARAADGAGYDWMSEFADQATGVAATFGPTVSGFAAALDNASAFLDGAARPAAITATGIGYVLLWTFLAGGVIDRLARDRATRAHGFFQACGGYFPPLLRLAVLAALVYGVLFGSFHRWLLDDVYENLTGDVSVERTAFFVRLALYASFLAAVGGVNLLFDYAKVRLVVEDRRSAVGSLQAAIRFIVRHPAGSIALYLGNVLLFVLVLVLYALLASGAEAAGASLWFVLAIGQLYIAARLWTKLVFWASESAWFQGQLAHAGYVSARAAEWPESAVAEQVAGRRSGS